MADTLFERSTNASWVVVFKALATTHHMCVHGNEVSIFDPCLSLHSFELLYDLTDNVSIHKCGTCASVIGLNISSMVLNTSFNGRLTCEVTTSDS